jgi:hypothetical protein
MKTNWYQDMIAEALKKDPEFILKMYPWYRLMKPGTSKTAQKGESK